MAEKIVLELGETAQIKAPNSGGEWRTTGSAAVIDADDLESPSVTVVGASIGRVNAFYKVPLDLSREEAVAAKVIGGDHMQKLEEANTYTVEIEVVAKGAKEGSTPAPAVALGAPGLVGSRQLDGLVPMTEAQDEPGANAPYGLDQESKPVMPTASMVSPGATNVARASEDATVNAPGAAKAIPEDDAAATKAAAEKTASKAAADKAKEKEKAAAAKAEADRDAKKAAAKKIAAKK